MSNYPGALIPYYNNSPWSLLYFYPFLIFTVLILMPIPIAVVFDSFRVNRSRILLKDRLKQKESLFLSFIILDHQKRGYIDINQWTSLIAHVYGHRHDSKKVKKVFENLDKRNTGYMNPEQFFQGCDLINSLKDVEKYIFRFPPWDKFREVVNKYTKLNKIVTSTWFDLFMLFIIILNMVLIILTNLDLDEGIMGVLEVIDDVFVYVFVAEFVLKLVGMGFRNYFRDNWNKFDFLLVVTSLLMNVTVNLLKSARGLRSAKSLRFFRIARSQRVLRLLKFVKRIKAVRIILQSAATFHRIKDILTKTILCITSFKRIISIMFMTFYIYAIIGTELLYYSHEEFLERAETDTMLAVFSAGIIGNFESFSEAWLGYFQILTGSSWHYLIYHVEAFNGFWSTCIILCSFHLIINYILRSILLGMIWEVFVIVSSSETELEQTSLESEPDSDFYEDDAITTGYIPPINPSSMDRHKSIISSKNLVMQDLHFNNLYKELFNSQVSNNDIKSMKRFIRRKFAYDNLSKMEVVPEQFWDKVLGETVSLSVVKNQAMPDLNTIGGAPRNIGVPFHASVPSRTRKFVSRPISARRNQTKLKINKILYNTEIIVCEEFSEKSESNSEFADSFSESDNEARYEIYNESNIDEISIATKSSPKRQSAGQNEGSIKDVKNMEGGMSRSFMRQKTIMLTSITEKIESDSDEDEELVLNGDYILRSALLKDHDIQELSTKEMTHCLLRCCKVHIGKDDLGRKIVSIYKKPEIKEITEQEVNTIVIQFLRDLRKKEDTKTILDLLDGIQHQIEKICPYGSMMRFFYKLEDDIHKDKDVWVVPNREETYSGLVRIHNFMQYFVEATGGNTPILIQDIFQSTGFGTDRMYAVTVNGKKKIVCDEKPEMWKNVLNALSTSTNGNLNNIPTNLYKFHLFCIPLKCLTQTKLKREDFLKKKNSEDEEVISISSLASLDEEKEMKSRNAMIMFFLCKKKKDKNQIGLDKNKQKNVKFSFNLDKNMGNTKIRTKFLIQALHDISDIFGAHHEKIFSSINDLIEVNELSKDLIDNMNLPTFKRSHSL